MILAVYSIGFGEQQGKFFSTHARHFIVLADGIRKDRGQFG